MRKGLPFNLHSATRWAMALQQTAHDAGHDELHFYEARTEDYGWTICCVDYCTGVTMLWSTQTSTNLNCMLQTALKGAL